ncbi:MAG: helix-turn-helix transcriptional regulator [Candidatus Limnocylindria bacterium]
MRKSHAARRASELSRYLGNELVVGRSITGISRKHAARLAGISHSTLGAIETGAVSPRLDTMVAACEAVGLSLSI